MNTQTLRMKCQRIEEFNLDILKWIEAENLWNIWVPKKFGGLEMTLSEGLQKLYKLSRIDGSLGWTVTLCSGANFFVGNLKNKVANEIFLNPKKTCLGGSGGIQGTAKKIKGGYRISGEWQYATGSHYLSHFTMNTRIMENGIIQKNKDGTDKFLSFIIPKNKVKIIQDWKTMGLKATVTNSFKVSDIAVGQEYSFKYDRHFQPQKIFKVPFKVFADLTLWVNYIGMGQHFLDEATKISQPEHLILLREHLQKADTDLHTYANDVDLLISDGESVDQSKIKEIHQAASNSIKILSERIILTYTKLGIKACSEDNIINQIFRDYFTATQHHNFVEK